VIPHFNTQRTGFGVDFAFREYLPCSAVRVDVKGTKDGEPAKVTYGAADRMNNLTSVPLAIGAVMLARGEITQRGVLAPEACIPPDAFIRQLAKPDIKVYQGDRLEAVIS